MGRGSKERAGASDGRGRGGERVADTHGRTRGSGRVSKLRRGCSPPSGASGDSTWGMDAGSQLRRDLLLDIVAQHGKDLLHKRVQLLLE